MAHFSAFRLIANHLLLVFLLLATVTAQAQTAALSTQWVRQITGPEQQRIWTMAVDGSGNVCVAGDFLGPSVFGPGVSLTNAGPGPNQTDGLFVAKYSAQGNILWAQNPRGSAGAIKVVADAAGNVYVMGLFYGTLTMGALSITVPGIGQSGRAQANFLAKFNAQGVPQWLQLTPAAFEMKDMVLAGRSRLGLIGSRLPEGAFVVCYDTQGNQQWLQHGTTGPNPTQANDNGSHGFGLAATSNGRIMMMGAYGGAYQLGNTLLPAGATGTIGNTLRYLGDTFLAQLDTLGNIGWARHANTNGLVNARKSSIAVGPEGNTYLTDALMAPVTFSNGSVAVTAAPLSGTQSSLYLAAYDAQGTPLWARAASITTQDPYYQIYPTGIAANAGGQVFLSGFFAGAANFGTATISSLGPYSRADLFVAAYDALGTLQAVHRDGGLDAEDRSSAMAINRANNALYIASNSVNYPINGTTNFGGNSFTIGGLDDGFILALTAATPLANRMGKLSSGLAAVPNPIKGSALLQVTLSQPATELRLLTTTGQLVRRQPMAASATSTVLSTDGLAAGIYILQAQGTNSLATQRVVIE
jgi:hypothetical protein